ncbi:MAG: hypothetical protein RLZZ208_866 [Actinomycetota bacterium]
MKLKDKKSQQSGRSAYAISDEAGIVAMPNMFDSFAGVFSPLIDSQLRNMSSRAGVRARGVSSFDFKGAALLATKVSGMNSSMLRARGSSSSPTANLAMFRGDCENEFSLKINHISPIQDDSREGILDSDSNIGKENAWSLDVSKDGEGQKRHESYESDICTAGIVTTFEGGVEHASTEYVTHDGVNAGSASAKNFRVATRLMESSIGVITHE